LSSYSHTKFLLDFLLSARYNGNTVEFYFKKISFMRVAMSGNWSLLGGMLVKSIFVLAGMAEVCQSALPREARSSQSPAKLCADSSQIRADSSATRRAIMVSVLQRLKPRYNAGYHAAPIHPYFRNEQRVVGDMRRLLIFVDRNAVRGFESVPELFEIAQKLPAAKQTAIIRLAVAGSVANLTTETAMKHLRRHKLSFVQLEPDRVRLSTSFKSVHASLSRNMETQIYTLSLPKLRANYVYATYPKFTSHSFSLSPLARMGLAYTRWDELDIFNLSYAMAGGYGAVSHDQKNRTTVYGLRLQKSKNWLGFFFVKDRRFAAADWLRLDFWLVW
jgi:hypothetical protein